PIFLHNDILHLFFNMIWLLVLGFQIEARMKPWKYILFIVIIAATSNTAQYLMTGPNFIGFSGVVCGMVTYIRARQKIAPWEGYQMSSTTFAFICFFIGILAVLSLATFLLDVFENVSFLIGIANTAHLVGASIGYILGRISFFSRQINSLSG
ncbi:MAG: rhomboid family intramembrane serine protease, partial [Verrucomicrobia bacterium]|nr:rhomboid family intramembrane serine protease [Verrucomicrobiota bacterium]